MDSDKQQGKKTLDTETKIKLLIALINDEGRHKLDNSMDKLITRLSENFVSNRHYIKKYLIKAILHIPMKTKIYANLITRLYYKNKQDDSIKVFIEEIFGELLQEMNKEINTASPSKWNPDIFKRFIRFYCECYSHRLISFASMSSLLDILLNKAKTDHKLSQLYIYIIVSNMHIIYDCMMLENKEYIDNLINHIDNGIEDDKFVNKCNRIVKDDDNTSSYLNYIWCIIKDNLEKNNHNRTKYILNLSASKLNEGERLEINFENELNINYDYLLYGNGLVIGNGDLLQELSMVDDIKSTSDISKFERYLIREYLGEIMSSFENNLEKVYFYFNNFLNFYGVEDSWEDNIRDNMNDMEEKDNLSCVLNYSIVEMILSSILNTHNLDIYKVTYLASLLYYITQQNKNISAISSKIISKIINQMHLLDIQSISNFSSFLSFYISNLQFKFRIESSQDNSNTHLKGQIFRNILLESLINLGNKSKLEELSKYSPQLHIDQFLSSFSERANWKFYFGEQYHFDTVVINDHIQSKKEYHTWRDKFESNGNEFLYVLMSCLFFYKSKTLTHLREILNSYKDTIEYLITKDKQNLMLKALFDVWGHSSVYIRFIIDYLFSNNLLEHDVLVKFLITERLSFKIELWWKNLIYLMDVAVVQSFKALERSRVQLTKEQQALAHSDDTNQGIIIGQIEQLEVYIEKMNNVCDNLPINTFTELIRLFSSATEQENKEATELVNEAIVQLCRRFKRNLIENFNKIESNYKALSLPHVEIDRLLENFNSL